jgi:hypothetical protein
MTLLGGRICSVLYREYCNTRIALICFSIKLVARFRVGAVVVLSNRCTLNGVVRRCASDDE